MKFKKIDGWQEVEYDGKTIQLPPGCRANPHERFVEITFDSFTEITQNDANLVSWQVSRLLTQVVNFRNCRLVEAELDQGV